MEWKIFNEVCRFQGGSQPPKKEWIKDKKDGYIRMLQIRDFTQPHTNNIEYIKLKDNTRTCLSNDILLGRYGASLGKVLTGLAGAYNVAMMKIVPYEKRLLRKYLYYYLNTPYFQLGILSISTRAAQAGFNMEDLSDFKIPVPQIKIQKQIVEALDLAQSLIDNRKEQIDLLDDLIESIFYDMFGDPVENDKKWEQTLLSNISINRDRERVPIKASERIDGIYPYYGASGIIHYVNDYIFDDPLLLISEDGANLLSRVTPIAFSIFGKTWVNNHAHVLYFEKPENRLFVEYYLNSISLEPYITGSAQPKLNQTNLNKIPILNPPIYLQRKFAEKVQAIEKQKEIMKQSLKLMEDNYNSLMQRAFKGELF